MLQTITYWTLTIIACYLGLVLIKELIPYIRYLLDYKTQGIKYNYIPILGWIGLYQGSKIDQLDFYRHLLNNKFKNEDIAAFNEYQSTDLLFMLNSPDLIKEFYIKELSYTKKVDFMGNEDEGFFWKSGKRALKTRAIFNNFFKPENLKKITPCLRKIFDEKFFELKKKIENSPEKKIVKFDLRIFYGEVFSEVVNKILFGEEIAPQIKEVLLVSKEKGKTEITPMKEMSISRTIENTMTIIFSILQFHPLNFFTFGLLRNTGILKLERDVKKIRKKLEIKIEKIIKKKRSWKLRT